MKFRHVLAGLLALSASSLAPAYADANQQPCSWVRTEPVPGPWWTIQGSCKVTITGTHFEAVLYDDKSPSWVRMKLSGSVQKGNIATKVEVENSDAGIEDFKGDIKTNSLHETVIILTDGYNIIGIKFGPNG